MRHIGLLAFGLIRIVTQLLSDDYWYFVGQSMFETYIMFYALLCVAEKSSLFFVPICYLLSLSSLNLLCDVLQFRTDPLHHILIGLLTTFAITLWNRKY